MLSRVTNEHFVFYREHKDKLGVVGTYQFLKPSLLLIDTQISRKVLVENFKSFHMNGFEKMLNEKSDPIMAYNPFFLSGDAWKDKRSEITPAFSPARIKAMFPLIESVCQNMVEYLATKAKAGETLEGKDVSAND